MTEATITLFMTGVLTAFGFAVPVYAPKSPVVVTPTPPPPIIVTLDDSFTAKEVLAFNVLDGKRTVDVSSDNAVPIASITKIMTALVALDFLFPEEQVKLTKEAAETQGDVGHLRAGEWFSVRDFMRAMMMSSSNDAAMAIAEETGGRMGGDTFEEKISRFVEAMNRSAQALGMKNTRFENPTGLDFHSGDATNYSSANDLALLVQATRSAPLIWEFSRDERRTIYSDRGRGYSLFNLNELIGRIPHFIGSKTGSTSAAGDSLIFLYEYPLGTPRAVILLGTASGKRFEEAERILARIMSVL